MKNGRPKLRREDIFKEHEEDWPEQSRLGDLCRREKELTRESDEATNDLSPSLGMGSRDEKDKCVQRLPS